MARRVSSVGPTIERCCHDGSPTSLATYLSVDGSPYVHLCRADDPMSLCGRPMQQNTHGAGGVMCPDCRSLRAEAVLGAIVIEATLRPPQEPDDGRGGA